MDWEPPGDCSDSWLQYDEYYLFNSYNLFVCKEYDPYGK